MKKFKIIASVALSVLLSLDSVAGKPDRIDYTRERKGPQGYDDVRQKWTGDNSGILTCLNPGQISCKWFGGTSNDDGYPIDLDVFAEKILIEFEEGGSGSGKTVVGTTIFTFQVLESKGSGDGSVRFHFISY